MCDTQGTMAHDSYGRCCAVVCYWQDRSAVLFCEWSKLPQRTALHTITATITSGMILLRLTCIVNTQPCDASRVLLSKICTCVAAANGVGFMHQAFQRLVLAVVARDNGDFGSRHDLFCFTG